MPEELVPFDQAAAELEMSTEELEAVVVQGEVRSFRADGVLLLYRADVLELRRRRQAELETKLERGHLTFAEALSELQMATAELRALVTEGELRAFHQAGGLAFRRTDVLDLKKTRDQMQE